MKPKQKHFSRLLRTHLITANEAKFDFIKPFDQEWFSQLSLGCAAKTLKNQAQLDENGNV